jgi:hypothetical protein
MARPLHGKTERLVGKVVGGRAKPCHDTWGRPVVTLEEGEAGCHDTWGGRS